MAELSEKIVEDEITLKEKRRVDPANLLIIIYMSCVVFLMIVSSMGIANATSKESAEIGLNDVKQGELLIPGSEPGKFLPAQLVAQEVHIQINGLIARTRLVQRFHNATANDLPEAKYVFPLPEKGAVDTLRMKVGGRIIVGEIKEKQKAKQIYEQARAEGRKTSLLSQSRPNMFITTVANIRAGETVEIEIEYQQQPSFSDHVFSLRFPMAITPRYQPAGNNHLDELSSASSVGFTGSGWGHFNLAKGFQTKSSQPERTPITLQVDLDSGFSLSRLESLYHGIQVKEIDGRQLVEFDGEVKADRDFVLEWEPKDMRDVQVAMFSEQYQDANYLNVLLLPPGAGVHRQDLAREIIFILDTSGSMAGPSIRQAKAGLISGLAQLNPQDTFNVIDFNDYATKLFQKPRQAETANIQQAIEFITKLEADGGTEMMTALEIALDGKEHERIRQVIFITDGSVSNEQELFSMIHKQLGDSRLFTVGIGSAPNSYFMSGAAKAGRGIYTYIGKVEEVESRIERLLDLISSPRITNIKVDFNGDEHPDDIFPTLIPDLYDTEPLMVSMRVDKSIESFWLSGVSGTKSWRYAMKIADGKNHLGVAKLWAREKIAAASESVITGTDEEVVEKIITETALEYGLVSKYTSLVAVDRTDDLLKKALAKNSNIPVQPDTFGGFASTATPSRQLLLIAFVSLLLAAGLAVKMSWQRKQ